LGNRVIDPSAVKTDGPTFEDAIKFLSDYVMYHFAAEEYVMIESHYPNVEHHRLCTSASKERFPPMPIKRQRVA